MPAAVVDHLAEGYCQFDVDSKRPGDLMFRSRSRLLKSTGVLLSGETQLI
jgi:hypothetical protein